MSSESFINRYIYPIVGASVFIILVLLTFVVVFVGKQEFLRVRALPPATPVWEQGAPVVLDDAEPYVDAPPLPGDEDSGFITEEEGLTDEILDDDIPYGEPDTAPDDALYEEPNVPYEETGGAY